MNKHRKKAEPAVSERVAAVNAAFSPHDSVLVKLVRLLARQAAIEFVAKQNEDRNQ
jgi:hypothetical protein